jgi:hypothetical protein
VYDFVLKVKHICRTDSASRALHNVEVATLLFSAALSRYESRSTFSPATALKAALHGLEVVRENVEYILWSLAMVELSSKPTLYVACTEDNFLITALRSEISSYFSLPRNLEAWTDSGGCPSHYCILLSSDEYPT